MSRQSILSEYKKQFQKTSLVTLPKGTDLKAEYQKIKDGNSQLSARKRLSIIHHFEKEGNI